MTRDQFEFQISKINDEINSLKCDAEICNDTINHLYRKRDNLYRRFTRDKIDLILSKNDFKNIVYEMDKDSGYSLGVYQGACEALRKVKSKLDCFGVDQFVSDTITDVVKELTGRDC